MYPHIAELNMKYVTPILAAIVLTVVAVLGFVLNRDQPDGHIGDEDATVSSPATQLDPAEIKRGMQLMQTHCNTCHAVNGRTHDQLLAPPLWGVRKQYLNKYPQPEAFVAGMLDYISEPTHEASLLPQAVERFGLMPMLPLPDELLRPILWAIYAGHVDRPGWAGGKW
jgi:cytochrome c553